VADPSFFSFCSGTRRATVHVRVNDVNEFAPVFVERLYRAAVTEGKLYDRILRVEAIHRDFSPLYSQICYYEILTPNTPFLIDNDGESSLCHPSCSALGAHILRDAPGLRPPLVLPLTSSFLILLPRHGTSFPRFFPACFLLPNSPALKLAPESSPGPPLVPLLLSVPYPREH